VKGHRNGQNGVSPTLHHLLEMPAGQDDMQFTCMVCAGRGSSLQPRMVLYGLAERRIVFHVRVSATAIASIVFLGLAQQITGTAAPLRHQEIPLPMVTSQHDAATYPQCFHEVSTSSAAATVSVIVSCAGSATSATNTAMTAST